MLLIFFKIKILKRNKRKKKLYRLYLEKLIHSKILNIYCILNFSNNLFFFNKLNIFNKIKIFIKIFILPENIINYYQK